jgi:hypothetical protein
MTRDIKALNKNQDDGIDNVETEKQDQKRHDEMPHPDGGFFHHVWIRRLRIGHVQGFSNSTYKN